MGNGIGRRIDECLSKLKDSDGENAFIQLSIAIEATSKLAYPNTKSSAQRNKQFLRDSMPFVFWSLTNGMPTTNKSFNFIMKEGGKEIPLEKVMYKLLRCSLVHEATMPDIVEFVDKEYIANINGRIILPLAIILSYCWAVIAHPVNKGAHLEKNYMMCPYGSTTQYNLNNCWGNEEKLKSIIRKGFLYDVEEMIRKINDK